MQVVCRYYQRIKDRTLWAILTEDGKPARAKGPLRPDQVARPAPQLVMHSGEDAGAWDLAEFRTFGSGSWSFWEGNRPYPTQGVAALKRALWQDGLTQLMSLAKAGDAATPGAT